MSDPIHMSLMIGPAIPLAAPKWAMDALTSVQVNVESEGESGFELTFALDRRSPLHTLFLVAQGLPLSIFRVVIVVTLRGTPHVIMDGLVTQTEVRGGGTSGKPTFVVKGTDLSQAMNLLELTGIPYPAMPREGRVALVVGKYAPLGLIPMIIPSPLIDVVLPTERIPLHVGTDLKYVRGLAREVGYTFYVQPTSTPGVSLAYWGPLIKVGAPQPALTMDMDAHTNVESLDFTYDAHHKAMPIVYLNNRETKVTYLVPIPDITPLNPPLGLIPPWPAKFPQLKHTAKLSPVHALMLGMAEAARTADAVSASGSLDVLRYGHVLEARRLVGVRGAGMAFNGLYYVKSVKHQIKRGEYKQSFTLTRNGLVSTVSSVTP